ncbi:hypothetical protein [Thioclava sp. GXIMD4216]|uniref:hypothetical protein n=1 Tax=Thioclava sp. GXIMD4216 TaxID=3131929 RepID=UPI0030D3B39B
MKSHLKAEVQSICAKYAIGKKAENWRYLRGGSSFVQQPCAGINLVVTPSFTYIERGLICLSQPKVNLHSALFAAALGQVFEKPLEGPINFSLKSWSFIGPVVGAKLRERYFSYGTPSFIDIDYPEVSAEMGYFQTEELPDYLDLVLDAALTVVRNKYDLTSERNFLASLPTRLELHYPFASHRLGPQVTFAVLDLMRGNRNAVTDLRAAWDYPIAPAHDRYLCELKAAADRIIPLA